MIVCISANSSIQHDDVRLRVSVKILSQPKLPGALRALELLQHAVTIQEVFHHDAFLVEHLGTSGTISLLLHDL